MTQGKSRQLKILNLSGVLAPKLDVYFRGRKIDVIDSKEENSPLTHILVSGEAEFEKIANENRVLEEDVFLVALSEVKDKKEFIKYNGRLVFDPLWMSSSIGGASLDKFFQEYSAFDKSQALPIFKEIGSFKVANPFSTGENIDLLVFNALNNGVEGLAIKTYIDHLLMFMAGLKNEKKLGWPAEVAYGTFNEIFGVQTSFSAHVDLVPDMMACMSDVTSRKAENYLINLAINASDVFDFTFLKDSHKVIITAMWTQDKRYKFENKIVSIMELSSKAQTPAFGIEGISIPDFEKVSSTDLSSKVVLPKEVLSQTKVAEKLMQEVAEEEVKQVIKGSVQEKEESQVLSGKFEEAEEKNTIKGSKEAKETQVIGGKPEEEDKHKEVISGKTEEDMFSQILNGEKQIKDDYLAIIKGDAALKDKGLFQVKSLSSNSATQKKDNFVILSGSKMEQSNPNYNFKQHQTAEVTEVNLEQEKFVVKGSEEETGRERTDLFGEGHITEADKGSLDFKKIGYSDSAKDLGSEEREKVLLTQVRTLAAENELMKFNIKKLLAEVKITKDAKNKLAEINRLAAEAADGGDKNRKLELELAQKVTYFVQELEKAERQLRLKDTLIEANKKTSALSMEKKEEEILKLKIKVDELTAMLGSNHNQVQQIKIKQLERENETLNRAVEMYKLKVTNLATHIEQMSAKDDEENFKEENRKLQMLNMQMKNQTELMSRELERLQQKFSQDTATISVLKNENLKLEQTLKKASFETKKTTEQGVSKVQHDVEIKKLNTELNRMDFLLRESQKKVTDLEAKILEAQKHTKTGAGGEEASKGRVLQLETSLKKLTQDLVDSKNQMADLKKDANKLRQEKIALQNKLDQAKKDLEKLDKSNNKSPKNAGKAA